MFNKLLQMISYDLPNNLLFRLTVLNVFMFIICAHCCADDIPTQTNKTVQKNQAHQAHQTDSDHQLLILLNKVNALQRENQELRGTLESLQYTVANLQNVQPINVSSDKTEHTHEATKNIAQVQQQTPNAMLAREQSMYRRAYGLLQLGKNKQAKEMLEAIIKEFPDGNYAPNIHYWLGEIYLSEGQIKSAKLAFNTVVETYPLHAKVADSLLKLGNIEREYGSISKANHIFQDISQRYPNSPAARVAAVKLRL